MQIGCLKVDLKVCLCEFCYNFQTNLQKHLPIPVVVVRCRSVGLSVFVVKYVLGEFCTQCQFLPLLFTIVRCPRYLLQLLWTVYRLQLWCVCGGEGMGRGWGGG